MIRRLLCRLLAPVLLLAAVPALAEGFGGGASHITPALVAESLTPAPGKSVTLAFAMHPSPEWHGYWKNPGDAGMETLTDWHGPAGVKFGPLQYPVPHTLLIAGLMNFVYEADYAELVTVDVPAGLAKGTKLPVTVKLDWLACNPSTCVPETANLAITLTVGDGAADPARTADFAKWRAALPRPLDKPGHFQIAGGRFRLELPVPASATLDKPFFFPLQDKLIDYAAPQTVSRDGDRLVIETAAKPDAKADKISGVLKLGEGQGLSIEAVQGNVAAAVAGSDISKARHSARSADAWTLLVSLGGAILGGILLNIMPCVFPMLSLKALSLARSGGSEADARADALAYTGGAVAVCAALGAVLLALRGGGAAAGWAFQLQDARVVAGLAVLSAAIGFNLAGLFELPGIGAGGGLAGKGGVAGAFWTGALAAFVATPCTGPFMAAALGAALLLPWAAALTVFAGLGLGLALPFLAIGFVPPLRRLLPRPGAWMETFRHILAVPMWLTALGLLWVLGRQAGADAGLAAIGAALALGIGLWLTGLRQRTLRGAAWWPAAIGLVACAAIVAAAPRTQAAAAATTTAGTERFDPARLAALGRAHRPVFLYFTADWCLSCKVNEAAAIDRAETRDAFARGHVATMVGDWTRGDPAIGRFLADHGRSGVPLYLWYGADGSVRELPQVLTPGLLAGLAAAG